MDLAPISRFDGLYGVADGGFRPELPVREKVRAFVDAGAPVVQLRLKREPAQEVLAQAREALALCRARGTLLLINDRVDLALLSGADGVHLGQDDLPLAEARALLGPGRLIGATVRDLPGARAAAEQGADYVGFGPLFGTTTKRVELSPRGLEMLAEVVAGCPVPVVAIGGIDLERIAQVARAGAAMAAVVSAALGAPDPRAAALHLAERFASGRNP